ncbi:hypothetical protein Scep_022550 [Stephania cephalantha]|uniref:Uncharacterized protein n=1 Tax=Stephania cephalantha TaxID=152367 RepID=A0AAP0I291_9MAGN
MESASVRLGTVRRSFAREEEHYVDEGVGDERGDGAGFELGELVKIGSLKAKKIGIRVSCNGIQATARKGRGRVR